MRGRATVLTLASVALLSCRAVLGIEDIEEGTTDVGACAAKTANECVKCCRDLSPAGNEDLEGIIAPCVCDGGCIPSPADCNATTICGGPSDPRDTGCIPCIDAKIKGDVCPKERDACRNTPNCKVVYDCLAVCK